MASVQMIRVLGPVDVEFAEGSVSIGSHHLRALLGALVIGLGHATPAYHLQFVIWGDDPPLSADNTLQSYISRLRHLLGPGTILSEDHSYQLMVDPEQIDAVRFERGVLRARELDAEPEQCDELCRGALRLWRGPPFGELGDEEAFRLEALRLDELRVATMELSLKSELALGRHELVVGELESAVQEYPFREPFWYMLVEALVHGGRRVEALRACKRLRETLAQAGLPATDQLRSVEEGVLRNGPSTGIAETGVAR